MLTRRAEAHRHWRGEEREDRKGGVKGVPERSATAHHGRSPVVVLVVAGGTGHRVWVGDGTVGRMAGMGGWNPGPSSGKSRYGSGHVGVRIHWHSRGDILHLVDQLIPVVSQCDWLAEWVAEVVLEYWLQH
jgi:hypothetical protein